MSIALTQLGPALFQQSRWNCCNGSLSITSKVTTRVRKVADNIVPLKCSLTNNLILFDNELQSYLFQFRFNLRSKMILNLLLSAELSVRRDGAMA